MFGGMGGVNNTMEHNHRIGPACYLGLLMLCFPAFGESGRVHADDEACMLPSVVMLPPQCGSSPSPQTIAAADAACDRLAEKLAADAVARVVDRRQLDRVLTERTASPNASKPMTSYDAMIRMEVDAARPLPEMRLCLIDLSTGNILGQRAFVWPPKERDTATMVKFCRETLKNSAQPAGKLRVRALWSNQAIENERLRPLGRRLVEVFDESLRRSNRIVPIRHLEAATAKEESLLLLMGLSRLPGGRQFAPQADATLELRVVEGDGRGKTFLETPVEIGVRLRKEAGYQGDWTTTAGLVRDFDALIPQAWRKLSQSLDAVRPEMATTLLDEMALRRKQAETELKTVRELWKSLPTGANDRARILMMVALPHAEAAIKLDPTYTEAIRMYVEGLAFLSDCDYEKRVMPEAPFRTLQESLRYMERFRQDSDLCGALCACDACGVMRSPLGAFWRPQRFDDPLPSFSSATLTLTPELVQALDAAKRLLERGVEDDVKFRFDTAEWMLVPTFRGMRLVNVPVAERQAWLETIADRCLKKVKRGKARGIDPICWDWQQCIHLQVRIAELLIEDGQMNPARRIMARAQSDFPAEYASTAYSEINLMRAVVRKSNDAQLLADFNAWIKRGEKTKSHLVYIDWPTVDVFAGRKNLDHIGFDSARSRLNITSIGYDRHGNFRPLGDGDGRLYFLTLSPLWIAYVPLDAHGRPIGKAVQNPRPFGMKVWDNIKEIPQSL
jgi:hypothetical protein